MEFPTQMNINLDGLYYFYFMGSVLAVLIALFAVYLSRQAPKKKTKKKIKEI